VVGVRARFVELERVGLVRIDGTGTEWVGIADHAMRLIILIGPGHGGPALTVNELGVNMLPRVQLRTCQAIVVSFSASERGCFTTEMLVMPSILGS
jgi:hypothetical protein